MLSKSKKTFSNANCITKAVSGKRTEGFLFESLYNQVDTSKQLMYASRGEPKKKRNNYAKTNHLLRVPKYITLQRESEWFTWVHINIRN